MTLRTRLRLILTNINQRITNSVMMKTQGMKKLSMKVIVIKKGLKIWMKMMKRLSLKR